METSNKHDLHRDSHIMHKIMTSYKQKVYLSQFVRSHIDKRIVINNFIILESHGLGTYKRIILQNSKKCIHKFIKINFSDFISFTDVCVNVRELQLSYSDICMALMKHQSHTNWVNKYSQLVSNFKIF